MIAAEILAKVPNGATGLGAPRAGGYPKKPSGAPKSISGLRNWKTEIHPARVVRFCGGGDIEI